MTGELTLLVLRLVFLAVMWIFVFSIIYALRSDLFGSRSREYQRAMEQSRQSPPTPPRPMPAQPAAAASPEPAAPQPFTELVITSGPMQGQVVNLGGGPLLIGRASDADLRIQDDYTSTRHARLLKWQDAWMVQDLDSTNGTYVNGERVTQPVELSRGTSVRIGTTTFELR